jgi:hypothetical protein
VKLIVCGGRDRRLSPEDKVRLVALIAELKPDQIVEGNARGIDRDAGVLAAELCIPCIAFNADWRTHGKRAGPIRNRRMAEYVAANGGGACVAFPGGRGTANMVTTARTLGLVVYDWRSL